jgi:hypothetical protein
MQIPGRQAGGSHETGEQLGMYALAPATTKLVELDRHQ